MSIKRTIIFANGELPDKEKARAILRQDDFIIAADGGTQHALALGRTPRVIIGDLDSLPEGFKPSVFSGEIILYPKDKNETDLELAIQHALTLNTEQIIIIAALGGRLDQTLANIALLADPQLSTLRHGERKPNRQGNAFDVRLNDGVEEIFFCRDQAQVEGRSGDIVSLIPWQGTVEGVRTENLKWPLQSETLYPEKTRGISNEMTTDVASVSIKSGLLLVVHRFNYMEPKK